MFVAGTKRLCELLEFCLKKAEHELIISSPWITDKAVRTITKRLAKEAHRISIHIYTDYASNREEPGLNKNKRQTVTQGSKVTLKKRFERSVRTLRSLGISIHQLRNVHNKSLVVDDKIFIDGSFNWLSAERKANSPVVRHDSALVITGKQAHRHRCEYLDAQYRIELEPEPLYLDDTDRDNDIMDFIDLNTEIARFPRNKDEPIYTRSLALPQCQPLFFAVCERDKGKVMRRGIDMATLKLNDGSVPLMREENFHIEDALVAARRYNEHDDEQKRFVVFRVERTNLATDIRLTGTFSRSRPLRDSKTPLQTHDIIPPNALCLLPTVFEES
ncbi:phospholipase [Rhizobium leguminosarum]|uniref:phospholipase D-like domain-containing protein n=1 Tax=Rhizobium leguminosarum TaxID=384 RepID=UPI001C97E9CF|nr:phospholipase D-like domain-containing protein [Rhizobium leguminosarum]MBY5324352.1 phospholipase [Rhizobium leguminosarum]